MIERYKAALAAARAERAAWSMPRIRGPVVAMVAMLLLAALLGYWKSPKGYEARHFVEGGFITALSSVLLGMVAGLSGTAFFLLRRGSGLLGFFWLLTAFGFGFFALDELLQFHETCGRKIAEWGYRTPPGFRNWNDIIVIGYGCVAIVVVIAFLPEIARVPRFGVLLAAACGCYVLHTAIDSICERSNLSIILEETAKLYSGGFFALAFFAAVVALAARGNRPDAAP